MASKENLSFSDAFVELTSYLDPEFASFAVPPKEEIENLYRYETWSAAIRLEATSNKAPDTVVYQIIHKNPHDLFIFILHRKTHDLYERSRFPDLALLIRRQRSDLMVIDPQSGKTIETIELTARDENGRPTRAHLFGYDWRIELSEVILRNQTQEQRVNQTNIELE